MKVMVIHEWREDQKDVVNNFFKQLAEMAKGRKLPKGMKLERVGISQDARVAVCEWDVESLDMLMQAAKQFNISWTIKPIAPQILYEHKGLF
ncbi:MAG: hypothetical protein ACP5I3_11475, partial [Thermoproteus sp.]